MKRKKREIYNDLPSRKDPNYMKLYYKKHRERLKVVNEAYRKNRDAANPNYYKETYDPVKAVEYRKKNRVRIKERVWKRWGIKEMTHERFLIEMKKQDKKCKICKTELKNPQVDHNHLTGEFRGILCVKCNMGMGIYEKCKESFEQYLISNEAEEITDIT